MDDIFLECIISNLGSIEDFKNLAACLPELSTFQGKFLKIITTSFGTRILTLFDDRFYYTNFTGHQKVIDAPRSGRKTEWHENGKLKATGFILNGRKEGRWTYWYDNGVPETMGEYRDDLKTGIWTTFDPRGRLVSNFRFTSWGV